MKLPTEILTIIFKEFLPQDLVSYSRACWEWNTIANRFLYETVYIWSGNRYRLFVRSVTPCENHNGSGACKSCDRRQQLGILVKAVDIDIYNNYLHVEISGDNPVTPLLELALATPNVHTAKIFMPTLTGKLHDDPYFDWNILAKRWTKLTSLTLRNPTDRPLVQAGLTNFKDILSMLQHLETAGGYGLGFMLPCLPAELCLQSLIAELHNSEDYEALKKISQTCRNTLHTLIIYLDDFGVDLDDINISSNLLKTVGIHRSDEEELQITTLATAWRTLNIVV